jgi:hypothetical protein
MIQQFKEIERLSTKYNKNRTQQVDNLFNIMPLALIKPSAEPLATLADLYDQRPVMEHIIITC